MTAPTLSPPADHARGVAQTSIVGGGTDTRAAKVGTETMGFALPGADTHPTKVLAETKPGSSDGADTGPASVATETTAGPLVRPNVPADQVTSVAQRTNVGGDPDTHPAKQLSETSVDTPGGSHVTAVIGHLASSIDDLEGARIAAENRVRALTRTEVDKDGVVRGWGLSEEDIPELVAVAKALRQLEDQTVATLKRMFKQHPLRAWQKATTGVGEKQLSRLLLTLGGDPYWHPLYNRPRTRAELRAFCGMHVVDGRAPAKARGQRVTWSPEARTRIYLIAEKIHMYRQSPYRAVYDAARAHYDGLPHPVPCVRCGRKGVPAPAGTPRSAGHSYANALRAVARAVLDDLWDAARLTHEAQT